MKRYFHILLFSVFILFHHAVLGQSNYYLLQHYTNENGLPSNGIRGIEYDKSTGFLWVGTESGLVRFDGLYFKSYTHFNDSINISRVFTLSTTTNGTIYLLDDKFLTYYIDGQEPTLITPNIIGNQFPLYVYEVENKAGSYVADAIKKRKTPFILPENAVFENDKEHSNFLILYRDTLFYEDIKNNNTTFLCKTKKSTAIVKIKNSIYVRSNDGSFLRYDPTSRKMVQVLFSGTKVQNIQKLPFPSQKDLYWEPSMKDPLFIEGCNLWKLTADSVGDITSKIVCKDCIPEDNSITHIKIYDDLHYIFIGSVIHGLYILKENSFHRGKVSEKNESETIPQATQAELYPGYIISRNGQGFSLQFKKLPNKSGIDNFENVYESSQGDLWYNQYAKDSIFQYKRLSHTIVPWYIGDLVRTFAETKKKLFAVSNHSILEVEGNHLHRLFRIPYTDSIAGKYFESFDAIEWEPGKIGIAAYKLLIYDVARNSLDTIRLPHTTGEVVRELWKYGDYIFIGTYGQGFFIYKKGIIKKMPLDRGGYLSFAHCFMKDDKGFCWISTNNGLFKVSLAALINAFEHNEKEIYYHYLGRSDGIKNTEFNGGCQPCALVLSDSSFSFPSMNGFVKFYPDSVFINPPSGKIYVDEIIADSVAVNPGNSFLNELPYTINKLNFKVSIPFWSNPENLYFSYQLFPRINEWQTIDIAKSNILSFAALSPGEYSLRLRVRDGFNSNDFNLSVIHFKILTPWYNSRLFYFFCLFGFLLFTLALMRWRTSELERRKKELQAMIDKQVQELWWQNKQLQNNFYQLNKQQNRLKTNNQINSRLISIISHDMLSPLKFIAFIAQKLKDKGSASDTRFQEAGSIVTVCRELQLLSGKILDWIRFHYHSDEMQPRRFKLYELTEENIQIASILAKDKNVTIHNYVEKDVEIFQYKEAIGEIINNLVMNAVKNTAEGEIRITHEITAPFSLLTVSDTGIGMGQELVEKLNNQEQMISEHALDGAKKYRFGYMLIKELLQLIHGKMKIVSNLGKGTEVTIKFKEWDSKI